MTGHADDERTDEPVIDRRSILRKTAAGAAGVVALGGAAGSASAQEECEARTYCDGYWYILEVCCPGEGCDKRRVARC